MLNSWSDEKTKSFWEILAHTFLASLTYTFTSYPEHMIDSGMFMTYHPNWLLLGMERAVTRGTLVIPDHEGKHLDLLSTSLVTSASVHHAFEGSRTGFTSSRFSSAQHAIRMEWELTAPSPAEEVRKSQTKVAPYVRLL